MSTLADNWPVIVGTVLPALISTVTRSYWSSRAKAVVSFLIVFLATAIGMVVTGQVAIHDANPDAFIGVLGQVLAATLVAYKALWQPTGASTTIENRVNPGVNPNPTEAVPGAVVSNAQQVPDSAEDAPLDAPLDAPVEAAVGAVDDPAESGAYDLDGNPVPAVQGLVALSAATAETCPMGDGA